MEFHVIPAIDLRGGKCVRLLQGRFEEEMVYSDDPVAIAKRWESEGAKWIHVVDLDGAREGKPVNYRIVWAIRDTVRCRMQVGGGIRPGEPVEGCYDAVDVFLRYRRPIDRVVLGTSAVEDANVTRSMLKLWNERIAIALDVLEGKLAVHGWGIVKEFEPLAYACYLAKQGVSCFIFTDVLRDGTMEGPNLEGATLLAEVVNVPVIVAGGIGSLEHVQAIAQLAHKGIVGCIIGRALYEGKFTLTEALKAADAELARLKSEIQNPKSGGGSAG